VNSRDYHFLIFAPPSPIEQVTSHTSETKTQNEKTVIIDMVWQLATYDEKRKQHVVLRDVLVDELLKSRGLTLIEANERVRYLEDRNQLFLIEDSFFIAYALEKDHTAQDKHREELQASWLRADERKSISVTLQEEREIKRYEKIQKEEEHNNKK
jgi:hypothetical protein